MHFIKQQVDADFRREERRKEQWLREEEELAAVIARRAEKRQVELETARRERYYRYQTEGFHAFLGPDDLHSGLPRTTTVMPENVHDRAQPLTVPDTFQPIRKETHHTEDETDENHKETEHKTDHNDDRKDKKHKITMPFWVMIVPRTGVRYWVDRNTSRLERLLSVPGWGSPSVRHMVDQIRAQLLVDGHPLQHTDCKTGQSLMTPGLVELFMESIALPILEDQYKAVKRRRFGTMEAMEGWFAASSQLDNLKNVLTTLCTGHRILQNLACRMHLDPPFISLERFYFLCQFHCAHSVSIRDYYGFNSANGRRIDEIRRRNEEIVPSLSFLLADTQTPLPGESQWIPDTTSGSESPWESPPATTLPPTPTTVDTKHEQKRAPTQTEQKMTDVVRETLECLPRLHPTPTRSYYRFNTPENRYRLNLFVPTVGDDSKHAFDEHHSPRTCRTLLENGCPVLDQLYIYWMMGIYASESGQAHELKFGYAVIPRVSLQTMGFVARILQFMQSLESLRSKEASPWYEWLLTGTIKMVYGFDRGSVFRESGRDGELHRDIAIMRSLQCRPDDMSLEFCRFFQECRADGLSIGVNLHRDIEIRDKLVLKYGLLRDSPFCMHQFADWESNALVRVLVVEHHLNSFGCRSIPLSRVVWHELSRHSRSSSSWPWTLIRIVMNGLMWDGQ